MPNKVKKIFGAKLTKVRLSNKVIPNRYKLRIQPDLEASTFVGEEAIEVTLLQSTKNITLHSKDLEITDGWWQVDKIRVDILKTTYDTSAETATFAFAKSLSKGKGKLHLHFRGIILEGLRGFYRSQYTYQGQTMRIATTQFEATDARRAFPCFDEPAQKAIFEVTLVIPQSLTAISNSLEVPTPMGVEHDPGLKIVKFAPTPKMSTYLLAFIVGDFEFLQTKTKSGITIRVFTTPSKKQQAKFALSIAQRSLEFLNNYFKVPYPLPTLDLIAIPDFSAAAMENWGAVTFRESALLVDEQHTAFANKQHIAEVIAHELVHQWFGNLVTMEWWTHLWLNESFASFMSYIVLDDLFPEWHIWTRFVMYDHADALHLDSLTNTHPIEVEVHHPDQISEIFDAISYDKGASVLRMLMHYIGPDHFQAGLSYYLKKHSYKNTAATHLWEAFEKVSGKPVGKFMQTWLTKPGYPLVTVGEPKIDQLSLTQSRFTLKKAKDQTQWPIPLQFELNRGAVSDLGLLDTKTKGVRISSRAKFVKANPQETGFYRTLYSPALLAKLYEPIKTKELSVIDRFGVIRDLFALAKSGHLSTALYLEFLQAYKLEDSYIIWAEILSGMSEIYDLLSGHSKLQANLAQYYRQILKPVAESVGWQPDHKESQMRGLLRSAMLAKYGYFGDGQTQKKAQQLFTNRASKPIHPDLRATVYYLAALRGDAKTFKQMQTLFKKESLNEEQRRLGRGLVSFLNPKLFLQGLEFAISKAVRGQDAPLLIIASFMNSDNQEQAWQWLKKNHATLYKRYRGDHLIVKIVNALSGFADKKKASEVKSFFKKHPLPEAKRAIQQVLEQIQIQAGWKKRDLKAISDCINTNLKL